MQLDDLEHLCAGFVHFLFQRSCNERCCDGRAPLPIALAMTEGHEKAQRRRLMEQHSCSEVEAAYMVAAELAKARA